MRKLNRGDTAITVIGIAITIATAISSFSLPKRTSIFRSTAIRSTCGKRKGAYKGIRIKNSMGKLFDVRHVQIVYSDGSVWNEDRQIDMYWGERSRPINPTYESKFIDQIKIEQVPATAADASRSSAFRTPKGDRWIAPAVGPPEPGRNRFEGPDRDVSATTASQPGHGANRVSDDPGQMTEGGDVLFGAQYVGFLTDRDVIRIGSEVGKFAKIRLPRSR